MMSKTSVSLSGHFEDFIAEQVETGRYGSASEVIRAGLRLLESQALEEQAKLDGLRNAFQEGKEAIDRGEYDVMESADDIDMFFDQIDQEIDQVK